MSRLRVVAFGGGTGLAILLRGLVQQKDLEVTAVVAVTDDGGSTGALRRMLRVPAVGDARRCLAAVATEPAWPALLEHRFTGTSPLAGHALGNLILVAACERAGSLSGALAHLSRLTGARARILPATDVPVALVGRRRNGHLLRSQRAFARSTGAIERVSMTPAAVPPGPGVLDAIRAADILVLGPGSLFSSVIAATLADGVADALNRSSALKILIQNLTTQRGETDGFDSADHLRALQQGIGPRTVDLVLAHRWSARRPRQGLRRDAAAISTLGASEVSARLARQDGRLHDPRRLAAALRRLSKTRLGPTQTRSFA